MSRRSLGLSALLLSGLCSASAFYVPLREYAGQSFFDGWDYWGTVDNTTWGNVTYLDQPTAMSSKLTYVNDAGHAIIRVDNTTNIPSAPLVNRPSIRLTTKDSYGVGTLWMIDLFHIPYGCSVWPSFWSLGTGAEWPNAGEIDIIEGINLLNHNQMAMHSNPGCMQAANATQSGTTLQRDCSLDQGCIVAENKPNSFGSGFAQAGGGVYAVQFDVSGVYMWFWSRPDIPAVITNANSQTSMDTTLFGMPSASYPAQNACNITQYFTAQQLILVTTLCGSWAGVQSIYASTCPGTCVNNVFGTGSPAYDNAYWEINYLRTYITSDQANSSSSNASQSTSTITLTATASGTTASTNNVLSGGALGLGKGPLLTTGLLGLSAFLLLGH